MVGSFFARKPLMKQINVFMGKLHKMHPNYMANLLSAMTLLSVITQNYTMQFFNELKKTSRSYLIKVEMEICVWVEWVIKLSSIILIQVDLFQKHLFLHWLTHNMTKYCSLNYQFSTWKLQAQNALRTCCVHKLFFVFLLTFRTIYVHNMF